MVALALLLGAIFFVVQSLAPQTIGEAARRKLLAELQTHYSGQTVSIRRGHFDPKVGLTFEDIRISDASGGAFGRASNEMLRVDRLTVLTDMHPEKILERNIPLSTRGVVIDGVHASAWLTENQQISLMGLLPLPTLGPGAPRIVIRNVRLNLWSGVASRRPVTAQLDEVLVTKHQQADGSAKQMIVLRGSADFADEVLVSRRHGWQRARSALLDQGGPSQSRSF